LLDIAYYVPCTLVPIGVYALRSKGTGLRLGPVSIKQTFQALAAAYFCVMLANSLAAVWSMLLEWMGFTLYSTEIIMNDENDLLLAVFAVAVLPGICEELLFRGVLFQSFQKLLGRNGAIFGVSLLFALLHWNVLTFLSLFLMGIMLQKAAEQTGTLRTAIGMHFLNNLVSVLYLLSMRLAGPYF
jgi:membrane protease YdiL (CAAX protease family)